MVIIDDHLAILAAAGHPPIEGGPLATTYGFWCRLARAVHSPGAPGSLSRQAEATGARERLLHPPADRLLVLDPRVSVGASAEVAGRHRANLLLAELVGAARHHRAIVRVAVGNVGRNWSEVMDSEGIDFDVVELD